MENLLGVEQVCCGKTEFGCTQRVGCAASQQGRKHITETNIDQDCHLTRVVFNFSNSGMESPAHLPSGRPPRGQPDAQPLMIPFRETYPMARQSGGLAT
jgi:hypothetical protein